MTTKSGPNGQALWTSLIDLESLPETLVKDLKILGGKNFTEKINILKKASELQILPGILPKGCGRIRKLVYFPEMEGKTRVVAELDYYSQSVLKPLHTYLFSALKKIPQDKTFSQGDFKTLFNRDCNIYSVDLTAATDRFPITVIEEVLKALLPEHYVSSWKRVMIDHPFWVPELKRGVSYAVGNPMGAYSSWASFAITHHYVVYYCCMELGKKWEDLPYCLLGDDIAIADNDVGEKYMSVMDSLGVEISVLKTHKSPHFFEFAKRLI